jgi:hypothetical protein
MDFLGTHAQLRVNQRHLRQIATDIARSRGMTENTGNGFTTSSPRQVSIKPLRRSLGSVMASAGARLSGPPTTSLPVVEKP